MPKKPKKIGHINRQSLCNISADTSLPYYDEKKITTGIVHLGSGAFHRGHQVVYTDDIFSVIALNNE